MLNNIQFLLIRNNTLFIHSNTVMLVIGTLVYNNEMNITHFFVWICRRRQVTFFSGSVGQIPLAENRTRFLLLRTRFLLLKPRTIPPAEMYCSKCSFEMRCSPSHEPFSENDVARVPGVSLVNGHVHLGTIEIIDAHMRASIIWDNVRLRRSNSSRVSDEGVTNADICRRVSAGLTSTNDECIQNILGRSLASDQSADMLQHIDRNHFSRVKSFVLYMLENSSQLTDRTQSYHMMRIYNIVRSIEYEPSELSSSVSAAVRRAYFSAAAIQ